MTINSVNVTNENAQLIVDALWVMKSDDKTTAEEVAKIDELLEIFERLT